MAFQEREFLKSNNNAKPSIADLEVELEQMQDGTKNLGEELIEMNLVEEGKSDHSVLDSSNLSLEHKKALLDL